MTHGQRRAERMHWWRQVLDRPAQASWDEVFDEMVSLRFEIGEMAEVGASRWLAAQAGAAH